MRLGLVWLALVVLAVAAGGASGAGTPPIVFDRGNTNVNARIYAVSPAGGPARPLTSGRFDDSDPAWSPDHRRIAFVRAASAGGPADIWVMNADGTGVRRVTHTGDAYEPSWSPDGQRLVFRGPAHGGSGFDLFVIDANGRGVHRITHQPNDTILLSEPAWSPDGKRIAFRADEQLYGPNSGVDVINVDGKGLKRLALGGSYPAWSPAGRLIAFTRDIGSPPHDRLQLWVMNADGTKQRLLTRGPNDATPAFSPDTHRIAFDHDNAIATIGVDGSGLRVLTKKAPGPDGFATDVSW
jgi:Tol biopolymer transport system component